MNGTGTAVTNVENFSNFDNTSFGNYSGGDFVVSDGVLYTSTVVDGENRLIRRNIAGIQSGSGFAAGIILDDTIPFATYGVVQIAGLGETDRLYGLSNNGRLFRFSDPLGTTEPALWISQIANLSFFIGGGTISDLSEGLLTPLPIPEPSTALFVGLYGFLAILRRQRLR